MDLCAIRRRRRKKWWKTNVHHHIVSYRIVTIQMLDAFFLLHPTTIDAASSSIRSHFEEWWLLWRRLKLMSVDRWWWLRSITLFFRLYYRRCLHKLRIHSSLSSRNQRFHFCVLVGVCVLFSQIWNLFRCWPFFRLCFSKKLKKLYN